MMRQRSSRKMWRQRSSEGKQSNAFQVEDSGAIRGWNGGREQKRTGQTLTPLLHIADLVVTDWIGLSSAWFSSSWSTCDG